MNGHDPELEQIRDGVSCALILERFPPVWRLDQAASTPHCLKYRRGAGEILIVNHDGRGWWDPQSDDKGDVFDLVQHLEPGLNFGQVRKALRPLIGMSPAFPQALREQKRDQPDEPVAQRWSLRPELRRGSRTWRYLTEVRCLPSWLLLRAAAADVVRQGFYGGAWFAHRNDAGEVTHVEARGPTFKGSLKHGVKILFRFSQGAEPKHRLVLAEAPINALSVAALERIRTDTLYLATGGGMGPETLAAIERLLGPRAGMGVLCSAADADAAGERFVARHRLLAEGAQVLFERLAPPSGDWNDVLKAERAAA